MSLVTIFIFYMEESVGQGGSKVTCTRERRSLEFGCRKRNSGLDWAGVGVAFHFALGSEDFGRRG